MSGNADGGRSAGTVTVDDAGGSPPILVRAVYFLLIGWWATGIWLGVAWLLLVTIVLMPVGIKMINLVPKIVSLKERRIENEVVTADGEVRISRQAPDQRPLVLRAVYFLLVGWWASAVWMALAWLASITIVGLPIAVWMYGKLPYVVSLYRY